MGNSMLPWRTPAGVRTNREKTILTVLIARTYTYMNYSVRISGGYYYFINVSCGLSQYITVTWHFWCGNPVRLSVATIRFCQIQKRLVGNQQNWIETMVIFFSHQMCLLLNVICTSIINAVLQFQRKLIDSLTVKACRSGVDKLLEGNFDSLIGIEFFSH